MWTKQGLTDLVKDKLSGYLFIAASNREPFLHNYSGGEVRWEVPASGLTTALDPVMRASGGTWIAHGSGDADREVVDEKNKVRVPPDNPQYSLRRIWLTKEQEAGHYYGFSNQALWPLCHVAYTRPVFVEADWNTYREVNELFARTVLDEVGKNKAFVFLQDYHLALAARMIREQNPEVFVAQFWHIPWPNPEAFRICPWKEQVLEGLLGNNLMGFHIRYHCNNFLETVERTVECRVDREHFDVVCRGKKTAVRPFPISVDFEEINTEAQSEAVDREMKRLKAVYGLGDQIIGLGLDRIDYTKGIPDRLKAIDRFCEKYPDYRGRFVFIQAGVASRIHIGTYKALNEEVYSLVEEVNWRHTIGRWKPILYMVQHLNPVTLMALRRLAHFCVVSALHDGMNLVAKEYVASRFDEDGVLILSPFTGAARELTDALLVNPYATDLFADAIREAVEMPTGERKRRMKRMRDIVRENNIYKWAADIITELVKLG